jgi:hypothetical protein
LRRVSRWQTRSQLDAAGSLHSWTACAFRSWSTTIWRVSNSASRISSFMINWRGVTTSWIRSLKRQRGESQWVSHFVFKLTWNHFLIFRSWISRWSTDVFLAQCECQNFSRLFMVLILFGL